MRHYNPAKRTLLQIYLRRPINDELSHEDIKRIRCYWVNFIVSPMEKRQQISGNRTFDRNFSLNNFKTTCGTCIS